MSDPSGPSGRWGLTDPSSGAVSFCARAKRLLSGSSCPGRWPLAGQVAQWVFVWLSGVGAGLCPLRGAGSTHAGLGITVTAEACPLTEVVRAGGGGEVIPCGWVSAHRVEAERDSRWSVAGSWRDGRTVSRGRTVRPVGVQAGEGQAPGALEG